MANNVSANPWYVDTPGAVWHGKIYIKELLWGKPTAGATLLILDDNGNIIISTVANASDPSQSFGTLGWVTGFNLVTLGSGNLSVFINK
jgi:hypothetical protein